MSTPPGTITRRSVAKSMAWTVPTLAVASAAPAVAASSCTPTTRTASATITSDATPNNPAGAWAPVLFTNTGPDPVPAGSVITIRVYITLESNTQDQGSVPTFTATSSPGVATQIGDVTSFDSYQPSPDNDPDLWDHMFSCTVTITTQETLDVSATFTAQVAYADPDGRTRGGASQSAFADADQTVTTTDDSTCTTTMTTVTVQPLSTGGASG